eukprot:3580469-Pyramimonas_sp.AAC.1
MLTHARVAAIAGARVRNQLLLGRFAHHRRVPSPGDLWARLDRHVQVPIHAPAFGQYFYFTL